MKAVVTATLLLFSFLNQCVQILNYSERLEFASAVAPSRKRKSSSRGEASVTPPTSGKGLAAAFDHVLEANLLADLRYAFRGDSLFWVVRFAIEALLCTRRPRLSLLEI